MTPRQGDGERERKWPRETGPGQHLAQGVPPVTTEAPSKPITVTVEEQRSQSVRPGADVTFICTAKSKVGGAVRGHQGRAALASSVSEVRL